VVRVENHCCGCASPAYPCLGSSCPNRRVEVHYCDNCGEELDEVCEADGKELCAECSEEQDDD
jgi:hypothetical protein